MNALEQRLADTRAAGRAALVVYLPVGYPDVESSRSAMVAAVEAGADVVEIGLPYTDPVMDGPVIQDAVDRALHQGAGLDDALECSRAVAAAGGVPVLMSYWNPLLARGVETLAAELADAGCSGVILPDLPPEGAGRWRRAADARGLSTVHLVAPSTTPERVAAIAAASSGFVYAASTMGVTGARSSVSSRATEVVERIRAATDLPVCVGVGVSTGAQAAEVAGYADGVICGSAVVAALGRDTRAAAPSERPATAPTFPTMSALVAELADHLGH
ncbi:tryptophan synthase, alpha chain [Kytococcus aerolatus]|uniref:Tryptophan synthase alpha chain n=1 Tax=Kytococcus aerolatus TaxID=592308 RepID=A0A212T033_9MICO|nr:tryptophan synthase subunit alpha [Kytococcus aerolatus]SNC59387.1 tryptophan synthase, alpha chain [Kytococcus aerolatus]